jgi:DNA repair protein RecO (recombination protein O)
MMLVKTEAIALRVIPFSESSCIVTWLSAEHGKIATMVKGVQRPKSAFLGQFDSFQTCELVYYSRSHAGGMDIARECAPLVVRPGLRRDWRSCAAASFACDLVSRLSVGGDRMETPYQLLADTLDFAESTTAAPPLLFWFELRLLAALGLAPRLLGCVGCSSVPRAGLAVAFSPAQSGILCPDCREARGAPDAMTLRPDVLALLRSWDDITSPRRAQTVRCTRDQAFALLPFFDTLLQFAFGISVTSRRLALEAIAPEPRQRKVS